MSNVDHPSLENCQERLMAKNGREIYRGLLVKYIYNVKLQAEACGQIKKEAFGGQLHFFMMTLVHQRCIIVP